MPRAFLSPPVSLRAVRMGDPGESTAHGCPDFSRRQLFAPRLLGISSKKVTAWLDFRGGGQEELGAAAVLGWHCD